ncbi:hypothetical protein AAFF_G00119090 [Aldrovandia affinis]|uniref:ribonuclease H n=1 Tax=Aldrovandia affinis TaxID=143900 RepID=A0AAD7WB63_9TELE|nr:hypothetical protein AAFF_G00119090 [Aldrovandia affinis]
MKVNIHPYHLPPPKSREKTAFSTPDSSFQYTVLPFGQHGSPATFRRVMDHVLRPHQEYTDDVLINGCSWDEHLEQIWQCGLPRLRFHSGASRYSKLVLKTLDFSQPFLLQMRCL